ncbi:MAG: ProQ/FINO family protein [Tsuneonella sp.]
MITNHKQAVAAREKEAKAVLSAMKARHPGAFPTPPRPLKVGIREDLIAAGWTDAEVGTALSYYLRTRAYLQCTYAEGQFRVGLDGMPVAPVQDRDREWARKQVQLGEYHGSWNTRW